MTAALHTFTNRDDGVEAYVFPSTRGGFNVTVRDLDSGEMLSTSRNFADEAKAIAFASSVAAGATGALTFRSGLKEKKAMHATRYALGCVDARNGSLFFFTAMGDFASREQAIAYFTSQPRHGTAVTIAMIPCVRNGAWYGTRYDVRDFDGAERRGAW